MTARSAPTAVQLADEMRARILRNPEAWRVLARNRPARRRLYDEREYRIDRDDGQAPLHERDPRYVERDLDDCRRNFWNEQDAGRVRLHARLAVRLARHLDTRELGAAVA